MADNWPDRQMRDGRYQPPRLPAGATGLPVQIMTQDILAPWTSASGRLRYAVPGQACRCACSVASTKLSRTTGGCSITRVHAFGLEAICTSGCHITILIIGTTADKTASHLMSNTLPCLRKQCHTQRARLAVFVSTTTAITHPTHGATGNGQAPPFRSAIGIGVARRGAAETVTGTVQSAHTELVWGRFVMAACLAEAALPSHTAIVNLSIKGAKVLTRHPLPAFVMTGWAGALATEAAKLPAASYRHARHDAKLVCRAVVV